MSASSMTSHVGKAPSMTERQSTASGTVHFTYNSSGVGYNQHGFSYNYSAYRGNMNSHVSNAPSMKGR
jgi:hypothetical protein